MKWYIIPVLAILTTACQAPQDSRALFDQYFEPYKDLIGGQRTNQRNQDLVDGMKLYRAGEYAEALVKLGAYSDRERDIAAPYLYMGICYMALGESYKAELQFDHLDNIQPNGFIDQSEWYTALCLLYSDQVDRCRADLQRIVAHEKHAYHKEANDLLADLDRNAL